MSEYHNLAPPLPGPRSGGGGGPHGSGPHGIHVMPLHAMPCMPCMPFMPWLALLCHAMPRHTMACPAMPCHGMPRHVMPCRAMDGNGWQCLPAKDKQYRYENTPKVQRPNPLQERTKLAMLIKQRLGKQGVGNI